MRNFFALGFLFILFSTAHATAADQVTLSQKNIRVLLVTGGLNYLAVVFAGLLIEALRTPGLGSNAGFVLVDSVLGLCVAGTTAYVLRFLCHIY